MSEKQSQPQPNPLAGSSYRELYRPQIHFSPATMWLNDPNGLVYYQGEYHLFYQYHPDSMVHGPMHWGHAVSPDLVHWQQLPIALYPDELGTIWSGSAVVDWHNRSGFQTGAEPPLIAIFTHALNDAGDQKQSIAYSNDRGRTFTKYVGNPVIPNPGVRDFRDPKVFWQAESERWVLILVQGDHALFYTSLDLKSWTLGGEFGATEGAHRGVWECPDLFELAVTNRPGQKKWVMLISIGGGAPNGGTGTQYFVGDFDGQTFTNSHSSDTVLWLDHGRDNYAGVSYADIPSTDGRRILIGWMSNWQYARQTPTSTWRGAMTVPRELQLIALPTGEFRLISLPVAELQQLRRGAVTLAEGTIADVKPISVVEPLIEAGVFEGELQFELGTAAEFGLLLSNEAGDEVRLGYLVAERQLYLDRRRAGAVDFHPLFASQEMAPLEPQDHQITLHLFVDRSSIEVFANGGRVVLTDLVFPSRPLNKLNLYARAGQVGLKQATMWALESIW